MKKIIRKRKKPEYLRRDGTWTKRIGEAWLIEDISEAINAAREFELEATDLVYMANDRPGEYDVVIPFTGQ